MTFNEERFKRVRAALELFDRGSTVAVSWEHVGDGWGLKVWGLKFVMPSMDECVEQLAAQLNSMAQDKVAGARLSLERAEEAYRATEKALAP